MRGVGISAQAVHAFSNKMLQKTGNTVKNITEVFVYSVLGQNMQRQYIQGVKIPLIS